VQAWVVERFSLWETGSTDGVKVREVALETGDRMAQIRDRLESLNAELIRLQDELAAAGPFHVNIGKLQADIQAVEQERTKAVLQEAACDAARQAEFDQLADEIRLAKQRRKNSVLLAGSIAWLLKSSPVA
jgi:predicted  nucleic acid-binding Zn-ribbon protein